MGRAIALELWQSGANIVVNYAHSKETAEELVRWLRERGSQQAVAIQADVSDPTQAASLINEAVQRLGRINIDRSLKNLSVEDWNTVLQIDLHSYFYTVKAAVPYFTTDQCEVVLVLTHLNEVLCCFVAFQRYLHGRHLLFLS